MKVIFKLAIQALSGSAKDLLPIILVIVLFQFGTGPIKGFAITLCIGIAASMFTAVFVSRVTFDCFMSRKKVEKLSI